MECKPCEKDTFAARVGSSRCTPCHTEQQYAPPGSAKCYKRPKCTKSDTLYTRSACTKSESGGLVVTRTWEFTQPKVCYIEDDSSLIKTEVESCPSCDGGAYRNSKSLECEACPLGSAPKDPQSTAAGTAAAMCSQCPAGTASIPVFAVKSNFRSWEDLEVRQK